jgi:two-component system, NarL family, sensor kinase
MRQDAKLLKMQCLRHDAPFDVLDRTSETGDLETARQREMFSMTAAEAGVVSQLLDIHEYERQRMGQELHDSAGQLLVSLQLSVARLRLLEENHKNDGLIDEIQENVRRIDQEIRTLAFLHHPVELGDRSLGEALRALVQGFARRTGIHVSFKCTEGPRPPAEPIPTALLRVAQEALVNIHRHSGASRANVSLRTDTDRLCLTISDNGVGIHLAAAEGRGIGLQGMRHRVAILGGRFSVVGLKHGTRISASMPLVA